MTQVNARKRYKITRHASFTVTMDSYIPTGTQLPYQSVVTRRVTCFIPIANTENYVSQN